jgi:hypothetical protein
MAKTKMQITEDVALDVDEFRQAAGLREGLSPDEQAVFKLFKDAELGRAYGSSQSDQVYVGQQIQKNPALMKAAQNLTFTLLLTPKGRKEVYK